MVKKILKIFENVVLVLLFLLGVIIIFSLLPLKNNYKLYSVMSGSMEPTIHTGSLILAKPAGQYFINDIITFRDSEDRKTTTHRIVSIETNDSQKIYYTKGDANDNVDEHYIRDEEIIGKYYFGIPLVGYVIGFINTLFGLIIIVLLPAVIIVFQEIKKIHKESKDLINKKKNKRI